MTEQQTQAQVADLQRKINDLEYKLRKIEDILHHIDSPTVATLNTVRAIRK
jgi:hypothetical protein